MDLLESLQRLGDAEHDDLEVAHEALAEIVRLRLQIHELYEAAMESEHTLWAEIDRLRAENEALIEKLDRVAALVNKLPLTKIAVDDALIVSVAKYNVLIAALRGEGE